MNLPEKVKYIINKLYENGFEGYVVGGCVRDYLLGTEPKDYDITTNALPCDVKNIFEHTYDTGIKHGTVTVVYEDEHFEITTYRIDGDYIDNRHPENVSFTDKIIEDLSRRDFTMNAIAYNDKEGFVDFFDGKKDIEDKLIKGVGIAHNRFREDALRMLRGARFACQLGFDIEEKTYDAMKNNAYLIENISKERIIEEMTKLFSGKFIEKIYILKDTSLVSFFLPEAEHNIIEENIETLKKFKRNPNFVLAFLLKDRKDVKNILKRLKYDNNRIKIIHSLVEYSDSPLPENDYEIRKLLSVTGKEIFEILLDYHSCIENTDKTQKAFNFIIENNHCYDIKNLAIKGEDVKALGITKGEEIGAYLKNALEIVLKYPEKNTKKHLL